MDISDPQAVRAVLADVAFLVPPVPPVASPASIAWLRSHVGRFSNGAEHERRRGLAVSELARIEPAQLRRAARERAAQALRDGTPLRDVPVETLAAALGLPEGVGADVADAARAYQPHVDADTAAADRAVAQLVRACGGVADEATATRIGLLVQACDATAGLVDRALVVARRQEGATPDDLLAAVLRDDPPVGATRRLALAATRVGSARVPAGTIVSLDLTGDAQLPFGAGLRPCPGRAHALALAAGTIEAVV